MTAERGRPPFRASGPAAYPERAVRPRGASLPPFLPRGAGTAGWPRLAGGAASLVWAAYLELRRTEWDEPAVIEARQLRQLRCLLAHAVAHVPYYRELLSREGGAPDDIRTMEEFRRLPLLARATYQERFADMKAQRLPPGTRALGSAHTSGTSGIPIEVAQTNVVQLWWLAFHLRDLEWCGVDPRGVLAAIRPMRQTGEMRARLLEGVAEPTWGRLHDIIETGPAHVMDLNQDPERQLEWLCRVEPNYLVSHPSNLAFVAGLALDRKSRVPGLRLIQTISEPLPPAVQRVIEEGFGARAVNTYSSYEAGFLASPCPETDAMHVHAENAIVEVLDAEGRPCRPGETGRVVLTTLHNFLTPFVRYEILDEATRGAQRCSCGRGLPTLARTWGKRHVMLPLTNGHAKSSSDLVDGLRRIGGHRQFQVVVRSPIEFLVRVVPDTRWTADHRTRITDLIRGHVEAMVAVEVVELDRIPLPAGGKLMDVLIDPHGEDRREVNPPVGVLPQ